MGKLDIGSLWIRYNENIIIVRVVISLDKKMEMMTSKRFAYFKHTKRCEVLGVEKTPIDVFGYDNGIFSTLIDVYQGVKK